MKVQSVATTRFNLITGDRGIGAALVGKREIWPQITTTGRANVIAMSSITLPNDIDEGATQFYSGELDDFTLEFQIYQNSDWQPLALNTIDVYALGNEIKDGKQVQFAVAKFEDTPLILPANTFIRLWPTFELARADSTDFLQFTDLSITLQG